MRLHRGTKPLIFPVSQFVPRKYSRGSESGPHVDNAKGEESNYLWHNYEVIWYSIILYEWLYISGFQ